jgi:NAD-dependent deacetylase
LADLVHHLKGRIVVFTGAGMSAPSGLPTFRGKGGLYEGTQVEELATPEGFNRDPDKVWRWYAERIDQVLKAKPNDGHHALAAWATFAEKLTLITSNVDDLHQRAGSDPVYRLHGDILSASCVSCGNRTRWSETPTDTPTCSCGALMRPDVVWFGEMPSAAAFEAVQENLPTAQLVVEVGVSGAVSYGFSEAALEAGLPLVRINKESSPIDEHCMPLHGSADEVLPMLVHAAASF